MIFLYCTARDFTCQFIPQRLQACLRGRRQAAVGFRFLENHFCNGIQSLQLKHWWWVCLVFVIQISFSHVNLEKEARNFLRPLGHALHEIKVHVKQPFESPERHYNYVRADTFYQTHVANGRVMRTELAVSLPDRSALGKRIKIYYPPTGRMVRCVVRDIGPWFTRDPYWSENRRPRAEMERENPQFRQITYPSGISLTPQVWYKLGINRDIAFIRGMQGTVGWHFLPDE